MNEINVLSDIIEQCAASAPQKAAFINLNGASYGFENLLADARFMAAELLKLELGGRPVAVMGEVSYGTLASMFGCIEAGCPVVPLDAALGTEAQKKILTDYEISAVFYDVKHRENAENLKKELPDVFMFPDVEKQLSKMENKEETPLPKINPEDPAFLFFTADGKAVILSHKNICASLAALAAAADVSSYTFLSPPVWSGAFDCVMGILVPLSQGCSIVKRGEKRSVARAIAESGATALTCTPRRMRRLERSLKIRSERQQSKAAIAVSSFFGRLFRAVGIDLSKQVYRKVHRLMGDNLKLIICGGEYPDKENIRRFLEWGFTVMDCYFTAECGPLAISSSSNRKMQPIVPLTVPSPVKDGYGELCVSGDTVPLGYYGGKNDFGDSFPTGDMGCIYEDGSVEIRGKRRTLLYGRGGEMIFPEEIASVLCRSRYVADCTVTGRFDTRLGDVVITARITPDYKEVNEVLGDKYSANRLRLFFNRIVEKMAPDFPHRLNEFKLPD